MKFHSPIQTLIFFPNKLDKLRQRGGGKELYIPLWAGEVYEAEPGDQQAPGSLQGRRRRYNIFFSSNPQIAWP